MLKWDVPIESMHALEDESYCRWVDYGPFECVGEGGAKIISIRPFHNPKNLSKRRLIGAGPLPLWEVFGLQEPLARVCLEHLIVTCSTCGQEMLRPLSYDWSAVPGSGYLALSVVSTSEELSLREQSELLGSERVVVNGTLLKVSELESDNGNSGVEGEPVLTVTTVREVIRCKDEVASWFSKGGGALHVWHYTDRRAPGTLLGMVNNAWSCDPCQQQTAPIERSNLDRGEDCKKCKGSGLSCGIDGEELCEVCKGFGSPSGIAEYHLFGVQLRHLTAHTFKELLERGRGVSLEMLCDRLESIVRAGFGDFALGTPVAWLSPGERTLVSITCAQLSGLSDSVFAIDGAETQISQGELNVRFLGKGCRVVNACAPQANMNESPKAGHISINNLRKFGFISDGLQIARGCVTALEGPSGVGKSRLLRAIREQFRKRTRGSAQDNVAGTVQCHLLADAENQRATTIVEALGLSQLFAHEIAKKREAQALGLVAEDLMLPSSRYRCDACFGTESPSRGDAGCVQCQSTRFNDVVAKMNLGALSVGEVMTTSLKELGRVRWRSEELAGIFEVMSQTCLQTMKLGDLMHSIPEPDRRFVPILSRVAALVAMHRQDRDGASGNRKPHLLLIDGPYTLLRHQIETLRELLSELCSFGDTIVYAGMPKGLEFSGGAMIELRSRVRPLDERIRAKVLTERYGHLVEIK